MVTDAPMRWCRVGRRAGRLFSGITRPTQSCPHQNVRTKWRSERFVCNPAQIDRQVAGSFVYGLSALFYQECTVKDGRIEQTNFDNYNSMRIAEMPKVESILMPYGGSEPWGGVGEPTICVAAPAVLNAFFKATGQRIRSFPLKNHNIQMA
jgi:isoquinoline 1-oxidoreductase subunit beta